MEVKIKIGDVIKFKDLANREQIGRVTKIDLAYNKFDVRFSLIDLI